MINSRRLLRLSQVAFVLGLAVCIGAPAHAAPDGSSDQAACHALIRAKDLTILSAEIVDAKGATPQYCYVMGLISPGIHWHMQLPLPANWNGRLVNIGNGGKAGELIFDDARLAQGYAVANSNTGHDKGSEPDSSFGFDNLQAVIDYGWRAVHVTAEASKTLVKAYYGKAQQYSYFEGCSTGGRQGVMEAQRFPYDFDGIVAGAPVVNFEKLNVAHIWTLKDLMQNHYAGSLAYDTDGEGTYKSLTKVNMLRDAVLAKCDELDGIKDGIISDPLKCDFNPDAYLKDRMCPGDKNADGCYTKAQAQTIKDLYAGPHDSKGNRIAGGLVFGSESQWPQNIIPHAGNKLRPSNLGYEVDQANFLFYEKAPGVPPPDIKDLSYQETKTGVFPEYAWWDFNFDDVTNGKLDAMMKIIDATDPDLTRFVKGKGGKLLMYQGWGDGDSYPTMVLDYYKQMVATTFKGDYDAAHNGASLFMVPGMGHCGGGRGPNEWDKLAPLAAWVEKGKAPDNIVAVHRSDNRQADPVKKPVDDERKLCPYPQQAVYVGPAGGQNDPKNWVQGNFACRAN